MLWWFFFKFRSKLLHELLQKLTLSAISPVFLCYWLYLVDSHEIFLKTHEIYHEFIHLNSLIETPFYIAKSFTRILFENPFKNFSSFFFRIPDVVWNEFSGNTVRKSFSTTGNHFKASVEIVSQIEIFQEFPQIFIQKLIRKFLQKLHQTFSIGFSINCFINCSIYYHLLRNVISHATEIISEFAP